MTISSIIKIDYRGFVLGSVVPFRKPLSVTPSFHEDGADAIGALAAEIYRQCEVMALTEAFNAKRANPDIELKRLVPCLTEQYAQEVIADEVFRASVENNMQKLYLAEELQAVLTARQKPPEPRRAP